MIREIPNRYEKLNFSSDDIQNKIETHSQGTPINLNSKENIIPTFSKPVITRESVSEIDSQPSISHESDQSSSLGDSSLSSSRSSQNSRKTKSFDDLEEEEDCDEINKDKQGVKKNLKYQKLNIANNPSQSTNPNSIKESLVKPIILFNTKNQYYIQSNGSSKAYKKRRLLSFHGEETGEFRELVTFLDKVQQNNELPANKMIRKNSCCCMECGPKSSKQARLDKLIPKFKPTQVIRNMYRKTFQKTINNISKINKFFRSKLQIRTKNQSNLVLGERRSSPTKFQQQSVFKISPKSIDKKQRQSRESSLLQDSISQKMQSVACNNVQLQQQASSSQNTQSSQQDTSSGIPNNTNEIRNKKKPTLMTRNSLFVYSDGEQHQQFMAKLQQLSVQSPSPFKKSVFNNDSSKGVNQGQQPLTDQNAIGDANCTDKLSPTKLQCTKQNSSPLPFQAANSGSNPNTPLFQRSQRPFQLQLELLKIKQAQSNLVVEDKIIDQLRRETKMGNINNDFVKSVGSNILRQSLSNIPRDAEIDSDKQKSKRTETILEDQSEQGQQNDKTDIHKSRFVSSYYRHLPKLSSKYMNPVLQQLKKDFTNNGLSGSTIVSRKNEKLFTDLSLDKKYTKTNTMNPQLDSNAKQQTFENQRENCVSKKYKVSQSQSNIFNIATQESIQNYNNNSNNKSLLNLTKYNSCHTLQLQNTESNSFKVKSEGKKKIRMKNIKKVSALSQPDGLDCVYIRQANRSCTNLQHTRQKSIIQQRPPFDLNTNNEQSKNKNETIHTQFQNKSRTAHLFTLFPQKSMTIQKQNHIPKKISSKFSTKASLPEINSATYKKFQQRNKSHEKLSLNDQSRERQNLDKQVSDSTILLPSYESQIFKHQSKGDISPSKNTNKNKKYTKSKSNNSSKTLFQFCDIYHANKKQQN